MFRFNMFCCSMGILLGFIAVAQTSAQVVFESATLGDSTIYGAPLNDISFGGVHFHLDETVQVTQVGGNIGSTGTLFIAILDVAALPIGVGNPFPDPPLAVTTFVAGSPSNDVRVPLSITLPPGDYVLVVGSGIFGATGLGNVPSRFHGQTAHPNVTYVNWYVSNGWLDVSPGSGSVGMRFVIEGIVETNDPPTALAGEDQSIRAGDTVHLDGSASFDDNTVPALLAYQWNLVSKPAGSSAVIDNATAWMPSFVADANGTYTVQLIVTDEAGVASDPDLVSISSNNLAPIAVATSVWTLAIVGESFALDGTGSSDPEGDSIGYFWSMTVPAGSLATLNNPLSPTPSFTPDVAGTYLIQLEVSDFIGAGDPVTLEIVGASAQVFAETVIVATADVVDQLGPSQITTKGNAKAFNNFLSSTVASCQKGNNTQAIATLRRAIERVDGCALRGAPDGNGKGMDWVTDCDAQLFIYASLMAALDAFSHSQ